MIDTGDIKRTIFSVSDFVGWQRDGSLDLNPPFQRRSVWKPGAKSYLVDTVVRGLPTPLIFIRERIDLESLSHRREVIDGQQRLRTLIAFIDPTALPDFDAKRDRFTVKREHNSALAGKSFKQLDSDARTRILSFEFSTHVLPPDTEVRDVLTIFQRLNSTGTRLNEQELRNAEFFGAFKSLMYELAYEQLERWLAWEVFSEDDISRMAEVELVSDLAVNMIDGLTGKTQGRLSKAYGRFDSELPHADGIAHRFRQTMDVIENILGQRILETVYQSPVHFFSLFTYIYDVSYGLGSALDIRTAPKKLPRGLTACLMSVSESFATQDVPENVLDAVQRAATDIGRRRTRLHYMRDVCGGSPSD